ncbi:MAG TPA: choice-of-anchor D domain-containing protein, partial [Bryobacteraceae bacterium]|nr:choice-of-anchor D domain-containing protein [Bryobacteraceae bacterium]
DYRVGIYPVQPALADLNGDGGADLAVPNLYSNSVSVLLNLPVISVFPNTVSFGKEKVGSASKAHVITLGNPSGTPITIGSLALTGAAAGDFTEANNCPVSPATLAPGATCGVRVTFKPTATGPRRAKISVSDSVPGSPQVVTLVGTGT